MTARETVEIVNNKGLHARASAKFVNMVAMLPAGLEVMVAKDGGEVVVERAVVVRDSRRKPMAGRVQGMVARAVAPEGVVEPIGPELHHHEQVPVGLGKPGAGEPEAMIAASAASWSSSARSATLPAATVPSESVIRRYRAGSMVAARSASIGENPTATKSASSSCNDAPAKM